MAIYKINNNKSPNKGRRVNESRNKLDWTYWEMPKDYKGPFEYPHYFKDFDGRYIGYVYPPYKSKNSRIDDIEGYQVELYDNEGTEPVGDFTRVFRNLKSAERYVEKMYQSVVKNESKSVNESYYDGKVSIRELSEIRDKVDSLIEMMDDLGMSTIKSDPSTYGLSTPFIGTSSGYVDLSNPEKYLDEEGFDDDDEYESLSISREVASIVKNQSLTEETNPKDYKVFSLKMDVAVPGDKSLRDFGVGSTDPRNPLYNAISKALESVGLEMAGDYIDSDGDVTDVYKDNDYEFFNESKSIKESVDLSVTDYEGILKFVTKGVQVDGKIGRVLGTRDLAIDITPDDESINKVISAAESIGFNEVDRFIDDSPMQDSWVVLTKQSREGKCVLAIVFNTDPDMAFVRAGYDEDEDYEYFESK